ncbi:AMP-binding enzyme family protein [Mycobacterium xenopi 4042]|uniref:AMP-binding enzyme family protein n=1 Tax=Mycobacterium xenopi 4042 TaxID=1299334 RepID=X8CMK1_MYCXE|nr:AMP-binding enzyme family protein [Mycobacterium xenopi 4042]
MHLGELRERSLRLAGSIRQRCPAAARIGIASENRPEIVELLFAIWAAECVAVPINYKLHPREMAQIFGDAGVAQVFASATVAANLASGAAFPIEEIGGQRICSRSPVRLLHRRAPILRLWRGCSIPAVQPAGPKAPCSPIAT